jgi:hypothetical protein
VLKIPSKVLTLVALGLHALCHALLRKSDMAHFTLTVTANDQEDA